MARITQLLTHLSLKKSLSFLLLSGACMLQPLPCSAATADQKLDVDLSILDKTTSPCDNFYQYACGNWIKKTEIPADRATWDRSFSAINLNNEEILHHILENYAAGKSEPSNPYSKLLGNFYASCMDESAIDMHSLSEFKEKLDEVDQLSDIKHLAPLLAKLHRQGVNAFFGFDQEQDAKDSRQVIGIADQGGLGLPDRDFYLKEDPKTVEIRKLYRDYITTMFKLLDLPHISTPAETILKIETSLAKGSMSRVDRRNPNQVYHRLERQGLVERMPLFNWPEYLNSLNTTTTPKLEAINVAVPEFFVNLNTLLKTTSLDDLKTYIKWHLLTTFSEALPKKFINERFRFASTALTGQKQLEERWKRCVRATNSEIGFALGRSFVDVAYGKEGKLKSQNMIHDIENQFGENLGNLKWMDKSTRNEAKTKLSKINNKIGFPAIWRSYDELDSNRRSYVKTLSDVAAFLTDYSLNKIGKPVDPSEWQMTPSTVNAYYDAQLNEMVFPAGILQYPFFNPESSDSLNYGAMGVVMGHELTHGYDDQGRQFDSQGNLRNWWSKKVLNQFENKTSCIVREYNGFEVLPGLHVNGKLTLGENIADHGGMKLSYLAWKKLQTSQRQTLSKLTTSSQDEVTPEQKFFLAFAQSWCQKAQEPIIRMRVTVDPHSPNQFRVNGVVSQFEPFAKAFACKPGAQMAPKDRCEVW